MSALGQNTRGKPLGDLVERALAFAGILLLTFAGLNLLAYHLFDTVSGNDFPLLTPGSERAKVVDLDGTHIRITGRLDLRRLGLSTMIVDGQEEQALSLAAVHLAGTATPGAVGNAVIAGHRDTTFWPLRHVQIGDVIRLTTDRTRLYKVSWTRIVSPDDLQVLQASKTSMLTLITCYPFRHVGSAPQRFIVRAVLAN